MIKENKEKIMVFGTFDGLHKGHLNFFKQARSLSVKPFLVVSVARDKNVFKIKKEMPVLNEKARLLLIKQCSLVDRAILAGLDDHIAHIIKESPDIIALGYDQEAYVDNLESDLKNKGLKVKIVRLKPYMEKIYKNHLLKNKGKL